MPRISALPPMTQIAGNDELPIRDTSENTTKKVTVEMLMPTGSMMDYAGASAPEGWLLCYGQTLNATTNPEYATLYDVLGVLYGGTGINDFKVPDLRGRVSAGQDDMGGTSADRLTNPASTIGGVDGDVLGAIGGAETHTTTAAQMPVHNHTMGTITLRSNVGNVMAGATNLDDWPGSGGPISATNVQVGTGWAGAMGNAGSGTAHNNVQPTIILNKIIKY